MFGDTDENRNVMKTHITTQPENDFTIGSVSGHIIKLAVPMTIAQLIQILYNIVDRVYIGHLKIDGESTFLALTGLGLTFPIVMIVTAFTNLFGTGGAPLFSIARGRQDDERAEKLMGCTFFMLAVSAIGVMGICYWFMEPVLYLFGASDASYPFAAQYLRIYLLGTPFTMIATGMNGFINAQGFARTGMTTVMIGALANILLDPVFIFGLGMGVSGAALATVISQIISAVWVFFFLCGKRPQLRLKRRYARLDTTLIGDITRLGLAGFIMSATNGAVNIACNSTLRNFGGDIYVGIMTVLSSVRDVVSMPVQGLTSGSQPVIGYNFGAGRFDRVRRAVIFVTLVSVGYMLIAWALLFVFPQEIMSVFNSDTQLIEDGAPFLHIYFFGFFMMAFMFAAQSTYVGLGMSKQAVFFSLLRKIVIVVPLTLFLPLIPSLGVSGVFLAEPISNFLGASASYLAMMFYLKKLLIRSVPEREV